MADGALDSGPIKQDLSVYQGDRYELFFRAYELVWDSAIARYVKGDYITLTGTPKGEIKSRRGASESIVATFNCSLGNQEASPGSVLCVLLPAQAELLIEESYVYDIQISEDEDHITTYLTGNLLVTKQVTSGE